MDWGEDFGNPKNATFPLTDRAIDLLEQRGIDVEMAVEIGVRSSDRAGRNGVALPYFIDGKLVNWKFRPIPIGARGHMSVVEGQPLGFFNERALFDPSLEDHPLIITEGEFDAMIAIQAGFPRVVSVPNGARSLGALQRYEGALRQVRSFVIASDGDPAGAEMLHALSIRLGRPKCRWLSYPVGKDLNDVWLAGGAKLVAETINGARWVHVDGVYRLRDLPPAPEIKTYSTGFPGLEDHYRIRLHDFAVLTGVPGMGKTTFLNDLTCRCVKNHGWHVAVASFEQSPNIDFKRSLRRWYAGKPVAQMSASERDAADTWIHDSFSLIVPNDEDEITMSWMYEKIDTAIIRNGARMVIIDPWNEMDIVAPPEMSHTQYVGFVIRELKRIARKYLVHVIVAAHPTKLRPDKEGKVPMPSLYDISDSANFANKADVGIIVHRDQGGDTIIKIAKSRYHEEIGRPGQAKVWFDQCTGRYNEREDLL